jgi:hypothetical protein
VTNGLIFEMTQILTVDTSQIAVCAILGQTSEIKNLGVILRAPNWLRRRYRDLENDEYDKNC